jgi:type IV secretory pathway VirB4 component
MPPNNQFPSQAPIVPVDGSSIPRGSDTAKISQKPKNPNSTQNNLLLSEVRDNMVIMADGSFRAIVACKSINFDLMSSREREGVEYSYQNFLNSLNHPIQILIRSQRIDIGPYIDHLVHIRQNQDNMLLNVLMDDYINFIDVLSQEANIMDKSFFIAIPYYPKGDITNIVEQSKGFFGKLFARPQNVVTKIDTETYEKAKTEIKNRVDGVMAGLFQLGVQSVQLNTKELGEMYYNFYNPDTAVR